jgi:hypothetical protein
MTAHREEELLNREVDGENTPEERAALEERLAREPELRARFERLRALVRALATVKAVDPPPLLGEDVLRLVNRIQREGRRRQSWLGTLGAAFGRTPALRYAYTFAAGIAVGVLLLALLGPTFLPLGLDRAHLSGTVLPESRRGQLQPVDRQELGLGGVSGVATIRRGSGIVLAEIAFRESEPVEVALEFDGKSFSLLAFERSGWTATGVSASLTDLRFRHVGTGRYAVVLGASEGPQPPLRLRLVGGQGRLERTLATGREP